MRQQRRLGRFIECNCIAILERHVYEFALEDAFDIDGDNPIRTVNDRDIVHVRQTFGNSDRGKERCCRLEDIRPWLSYVTAD